jgi:hypothetical protein
MKDLLTHIPPTLHMIAGELVITTAFDLDGKSYSVSAPIGDGRYHAQRVHELIIAPALGRHPLDGREPFAPVDDPNAV